MKTVQVEQEFVNALMETFDKSGLDYEVFEGNLLHNFVFTADKMVSGVGRKTKYIIIREVALNEWSSAYEMILTDSDKKACAFAQEFEEASNTLNDEQEDQGETVSEENTLVVAWYTEAFPTDELSSSIASGVTFRDLFEVLDNYLPIDHLLGDDSMVRERVFEKLVEIMKVDYDYVYEQWLKVVVTK